jgi:uncharacterized protein
MADARLLIWDVHEIAGFDTAWPSIDARTLLAEGHSAGLRPRAFWVGYRLETGPEFVTRAMDVTARWDGGSATVAIRNDDGRWTVNGEARPDLAGALDIDLMACPLTNTMPILRHDLHREPGEHELLMAFIRIPTLEVVPNRQRYTFLERLPAGGARVRYASDGFTSDLTVDDDGFVVDYPQLGRRLQPG